MTVEAFRALIRYLYTAELALDSTNAIQVMQLAHLYDIRELYDLCRTLCTRNLSVHNCLDLLMQARKYGLEALEKNALNFVAAHLQDGTIQSEAPQTLEAFAHDPDLVKEVLSRFQPRW